MCKYELALKFYLKTLKIKEELLGENHLSTASTYNNLALLYQDMKEYEKSLEFNFKALKVREEVLGIGDWESEHRYNL